MLSILIPTFHYNAYPLAKQLEQQALACGVSFELICIDDGSLSEYNTENQKINTLTNCVFIEAKKNIGRTAIRQTLAHKSQYKWLLFLDADVLPVSINFINNIVAEMHTNCDVIFGGISYEEKKPSPEKLLRWFYGKKRETTALIDRKKSPYFSIISGCFAIKKDLFIKTNKKLLLDAYGLDIIFTSLLKKAQVNVSHIENPVYHLGIENSDAYLIKSKKALETLYQLRQNNTISPKATKLLKLYNVLNTFRLASSFGKLIKKYESKLEENLKSESPNLFLFDMYRLGYFCNIKP